MARYTPGTPPQDAASLAAFLRLELAKIAQANETADQMVNLDMQYAAPSKYRDGTVCLADGNMWKPTGAATPGFYGYYNGAWHFLG